MKNTLKTLAAVAAGLLAANGAYAGGTHVITVSAAVTGTCVVNTATSTLDFGTLDQIGGGTVNATWSGGTFRCTTGTAYTVTSDDGLNESGPGGANNRMKLSTAANCTVPSDCIKYSLTAVTGGTGLGMTNNISFAVTGSAAQADYQNAKAGSYGDTVTLTVSP